MEKKDAPNVLGDFEIIRLIGRGGMGVVYEAQQRSLNRRVALKILSSGLGLTEKAVTRFRREAEAAAKLHHTNIVPIYATGEDRGNYYYAMELIDGPSLDQVIRRLRSGKTTTLGQDPALSDSSGNSELPAWVSETLSYEKVASDKERPVAGPDTSRAAESSRSNTRYFDTVAQMMADVADALDHAHAHGVIHRDIKPSNLLLSQDGRLSVNDFGLARVLEQPGVTMTGEFLGSPLYMSPEQITAGRAPLDHRTDVYSLGATLYEMLTLQPPFPGRTRDEVIAQILHKEPRTPRRVNRKISIDLETICLKAIAGDPDRRYQSAGDFSKDLRNYVNRFAITARRTGVLGRLAKYARRHPANTALIVVVFLAILATGGFIYHWRQRERQNELERLQERVVEAILKGNFSSAKELQEDARGLGATRYWKWFTDGQIELYQGDYKEAIGRLKAALGEKPDSIPAQSLLAVANLWGGNEPAYFRGLKAIKNRSASDFDDYLYLGFVNVWQNPDDSLAFFEQAEKESPNHNIVRLYRAQASRLCAMKIGNNPEEALSLAKEAIADADTSCRVLENSPVAAAEFALANLVAGNICNRLARKSPQLSEQLLLDSRRYLDVAKKGAENLKRFSESSDAAYARFLIFAETDYEPGICELIGELDHRNRDLNPYLFQLAGTLLFQMDDPDANFWLQDTPGLQGEYCQFMEFFLEMCQPGFSPESMDVKGRVRRYIDKKVSEGNSAYLEIDRCVVALLGDPDDAARVLEKIQPLQMVDHVYGDVYRYLRKDGIVDPKELLQLCKHDNRLVCEANFFLAIESLSQGDREQAKVHFRQSLDADMFPFYAHWWSGAFLKHMERNPGWPDWIPQARTEKESAAR